MISRVQEYIQIFLEVTNGMVGPLSENRNSGGGFLLGEIFYLQLFFRYVK